MGGSLQLETAGGKLWWRRLTTWRGAISQPFAAVLPGIFGCGASTEGTMIAPGNGHCVIALGGKDIAEAPLDNLFAYEDEHRAEVARRLGGSDKHD